MGLCGKLCRLATVLGLMGLGLWPLAMCFEPERGPLSLLGAVAICLGTGASMLVFEASFEGHSLFGFWSVGLGFVYRMGLPLLVCGLVALLASEAAAQSLARYLLLIYPVMLTLDTYWLVAGVDDLRAPGSAG